MLGRKAAGAQNIHFPFKQLPARENKYYRNDKNKKISKKLEKRLNGFCDVRGTAPAFVCFHLF